MVFEDVFSRRLQLDESLFYIDKDVVEIMGLVKIVKRRCLYGLQYGSEEILPTVFDLIRFINGSMVEIQISDLSGLYSVNNRNWIFMPSHYHLRLLEEMGVVEVMGEKGMGLFSLSEKRMVVPPKFDVTTNTDMGEYLWVRKGELFHFICKNNQIFYSAVDARMAYDTDKGMWVKHSDGRVALLNKAGNDDTKTYRKILIQNGGRIKLQNIKYGIIDICDIYGHILG